MNYPNVTQLLMEFSNQVKYKLDETFSYMSAHETSAKCLSLKFKEAVAEVVQDKLRNVDFKLIIEEAVRSKIPASTEQLYVLPNGNAILLSSIEYVSASNNVLVLSRAVHNNSESIHLTIELSSAEDAALVRDDIIRHRAGLFKVKT